MVAIAGGAAVLGAGAKIYSGIKQGQAANKINPNYKAYTESPYAKQSLGLAQQMFNSRMAGAADASRGIQNTQGNQIANIQRNATDSSTALALGAAAQGQADSSVNNLGVQEGQYKMGLLDNVQNAYNQLTREHQNIYQDQFDKYKLDSAAKQQLKNASTANIVGGIGDVASGALGFASAGLGIGGGAGKALMGGVPTNLGQQTTQSSSMPSQFNQPTQAPQQFMGNMNPALSADQMKAGLISPSEFSFKNKYFKK
jgi:hypothetical protein